VVLGVRWGEGEGGVRTLARRSQHLPRIKQRGRVKKSRSIFLDLTRAKLRELSSVSQAEQAKLSMLGKLSAAEAKLS
jgi:hypothetical protein